MRPTPTLVRFEIESSREEGGQLLVSGKGLAGESFKDLLFIQPHGAASRPPAGSIGIASVMPGRRTQSLVVGVEHNEHRPALPDGAAALYDHAGNIIKLTAGGVTLDFGNRTITHTSGEWNIECEGLSISAGANGVTMTGTMSLIGDLAIDGNIQVTGNVTAAGSVTDGDGDGGA